MAWVEISRERERSSRRRAIKRQMLRRTTILCQLMLTPTSATGGTSTKLCIQGTLTQLVAIWQFRRRARPVNVCSQQEDAFLRSVAHRSTPTQSARSLSFTTTSTCWSKSSSTRSNTTTMTDSLTPDTPQIHQILARTDTSDTRYTRYPSSHQILPDTGGGQIQEMWSFLGPRADVLTLYLRGRKTTFKSEVQN